MLWKKKSRERKRDTQRKILIGAYFIDKASDKDSLDSLVPTNGWVP
jgi:hypothetical protein